MSKFQVGFTFPGFAMMTMTNWQLFGSGKAESVLTVLPLMVTLSVLQTVITNKFHKSVGTNFLNSKKLCGKRYWHNGKIEKTQIFSPCVCVLVVKLKFASAHFSARLLP